ncbi:tetraacyldisaccharide 4'-kinase [Olivibacter sitiensis]|uniref:tetraacyldisaccharide 4'-kinase n=1 Tax=Olivibacter sitiensis TaxID=376470 RepID=UPI0012FB0C02|nr:tetraacyldisaccharide 4'-kinase [Olivibacter sitiensis]
MMKFLRLLLLPFSLLYALVLYIRHFLYDKRFLKSVKFDFPVIVIGNLIVGGAGKSPMTEYLARLLSKQSSVAILSRGYGRRTKGFHFVAADSAPGDVGDEPLQMKRKFPTVSVAVCENRVMGVERLRASHGVVLLDDAFQHRALQGGLQILLFNYHSVCQPKWVLPAGDYRDLYARREFADIIVVTKCPLSLQEVDKKKLKAALALPRPIPVFFSCLWYGVVQPVWAAPHVPTPDLKDLTNILLVTGIAQPQPLVDYLHGMGINVRHLAFADHHYYTNRDIRHIMEEFKRMDAERKIILTTEKDAVKLREHEMGDDALLFFYLPIEQRFLGSDGINFDDMVIDFVKGFMNNKLN